MASFQNDYVGGAHPDVLKHLVETNGEALPGYGSDRYCDLAKEKIRAACGCPEADVELLTGGTQTNMIVISTILRGFEGVVAATTGHVSGHEAGAIEYSGHKVLQIPEKNGKIEAPELRKFLKAFYDDRNREHMVYPGMVYISHPTEYGTLYSKKEMEDIAAVCREYGIPLYLDGARLGYGLMSEESDLTLPDIARICDAFYIGGTKVGALCGEAVVFSGIKEPEHFINLIKKRGALLAKGRLVGVQFDALFTDDLYFRISRHAILMAEKMKKIFREKGLRFYIDSPTNQQFIVLENEQMEALAKEVNFGFWENLDETHKVVRFATSWSTTEEDIEVLAAALDKI